MKQNYYFRRILSALLLLMASSLSWGYNFMAQNADGVTIYYNLINGGTEAEVTSEYENYLSASYFGETISIPETVVYDGKPYRVTSIGDDAFCYCSSLTSVTIPNSVISIGDGAFNDCSGLTSIDIPGSVTSISNSAFLGCRGLTSITVDKGNPIYDSRENCNAIIETASNTLYVGCPNTVIPASVTSIGDKVFNRCSGLTSITIPEGVTSIGNYAFSGCRRLTSIIIPKSVTSIGNMAFYYCDGLTSITIPEGVTSIGNGTFGLCSSLTSVDIPGSVTSIGYMAFENCSSLTSINIPEGVTSIEDYAFTRCSSLTTVICRAENVPELGGNYVFNAVPTSEATLYVPASALEAYKTADQWKNFGTILPLEEEEEEVTLAIGDAHYATFIAPFDVKIPANVTAYTVSGIKEDGETLQMDELTRTIPANTPVVLYSNDMVDETVTGIRTTQGTTYTNGLLTGVYKERQAPAGSYVLQKQDDEVAFYYVAEGNQPAVKANRAYLTVPNANGIKAFRFGIDDETTGIQATVGDQENKAVIYDMTGRRVEKATKGMYIIDGKKVMVK